MIATKHKKHENTRSVSITRKAFDRLTKGLPRTSTGRVRGMQARLEPAILAALAAEAAHN